MGSFAAYNGMYRRGTEEYPLWRHQRECAIGCEHIWAKAGEKCIRELRTEENVGCGIDAVLRRTSDRREDGAEKRISCMGFPADN